MPNGQSTTPKYKFRWYQYSLRSLLVLTTIVAILCSIGACTHWAVPIGLSAIAISVVLLTGVIAQLSTRYAHIVVVTAQILGVSVNIIIMSLALIVGLIGLSHGTDTSDGYNNCLALGGFSCAAIATINWLALLVSSRGLFHALSPIAVAGNSIMLALVFISITYPTLNIGDIQSSLIFYGLAFISITTIAVRRTYLSFTSPTCNDNSHHPDSIKLKPRMPE